MCVEPLLGFLGRTLWPMAIATGMIAAMVSATVLARREAVAVRPGCAVAEGADGLLVREGEGRRALERLWSVSVEDISNGGHEENSCMSELIRSEASS